MAAAMMDPLFQVERQPKLLKVDELARVGGAAIPSHATRSITNNGSKYSLRSPE
jgi:hypothetical protein